VIVSEASLAALLLTNRLVDIGAKPLSAGEYWALVAKVPDLGALLGVDEGAVADLIGGDTGEAQRIAALLAATTAFAFERERLEDEGVRLLSTFDPTFPSRLIHRLGTTCPAFLTVAGPVGWLSAGGLGVVGSHDASPAALEVARSAAQVAVDTGVPVVSGLARGIDHESMASALDRGGAVVGVPAEGLRVAARSPEVRRRVHSSELCIASPYAPAMRFTAGNAMGRNKIVYGLADVTLVVCSDNGSGGTWEGAKEAIRRGFGPVAVWSGDGAGPGNAAMLALGGIPMTNVHDVFEITGQPIEPRVQGSLFG
jgi:predicted Rossmann fold nucleotide-binding protein DprA/Smf involved in DNA uptake